MSNDNNVVDEQTTTTTTTTTTCTQNSIENEYAIEKTIGQGHYAVVKSARHLFSGERVAMKIIDKTKLDKISREHLYHEVKCMKLIKHPNVVRLYEVIDAPTKLYLILELGDGGDMYDLIMKHTNGLSEPKAKIYFRQIVKAIKYCHELHVVHRDLKPENLVFTDQTGQVKLTDFGFSNVFVPGTKMSTSCGSLAYSAPEILLGDAYDAPAVDVWSLGVILFMLVTGRPPFNEANDSETLTMILDCKYKFPATKHLSNECIDLISRMLVREPTKRINLNDLAEHVWLQTHANDVDASSAPSTMTECTIPFKLNLNDDAYHDDCCISNETTTATTATDCERRQQYNKGTLKKTSCRFHRTVCLSLSEEHYLKLAPLIKNRDQNLTDKDKQDIIESMINGKIGTREQIEKELGEDNYNYITATYYLLAESMLKRQLQKKLKLIHEQQQQMMMMTACESSAFGKFSISGSQPSSPSRTTRLNKMNCVGDNSKFRRNNLLKSSTNPNATTHSTTTTTP